MDGSYMHFMYNLSPSPCNDLNEVDASSSYVVDTSLRLNSHSIEKPNVFDLGGRKGRWNEESLSLKNDISLSLELGHQGSSSEVNTNSVIVDSRKQPTNDICLDFSLNLGGKIACNEVRNTSPSFCADEKERPNIDLELSLPTGAAESDVTSVTLSSLPINNGMEIQASSDIVQLVDEGSTSSKWKRGPLLLPFDGSRPTDVVMLPKEHSNNTNPVSIVLDSPPSKSKLDSASTSGSKPRRKTAVKTCQFPGCEKGARGASGHCISHGGGRRCQKPGCQKGAEGKTAFCKTHGGGRRCEHLGCTKSAEGRTNLCIAHGGGRRCSFLGGCTRAARGKSGLCIRHGGGKRCKIENCTKSAEGLSGLCIAHGGGRRCQFPQCTKGAQGGTKLCKAHGGGKRCTFLGCTKGAEGSTPLCKAHGGGKRCTFQGGGVCTKSVHGGTLLCVSHGGGKRCAITGCSKSARGRTNFCVRHGGGRRCTFEGCGKSAQGSTNFCTAHGGGGGGGGKRCLWGQIGSGFGENGDGPCDKFGRGKVNLCTSHAAQVHNKRVHGDGTVGMKMKPVMTSYPIEEHLTSQVVHSVVAQRCDLVPTQTVQHGDEPPCGDVAFALMSLPEGRVHGGSLMALLTGGAGIRTAGLK